ncbi:cadherin domain-containing protein [Gammaproteobacteria bacterium AH-315-E17]|nr:cadherin domain-containing protein [Gammaproteobacteria bacterium AH-315-E17]
MNNPAAIFVENSQGQAIEVKEGQENNIQAAAGEHYRIVDASNGELANNVMARKQGDDLIVTAADGAEVVFEDFYLTESAVDLAGEEEEVTVTAESPVGAELSDGSSVVYAYGDSDVLMSMVSNVDVINLDMEELPQGAVSYTPASSSAPSGWLWGLALVGAGIGYSSHRDRKDDDNVMAAGTDTTAPVFPDGATKAVTIDENAATSTVVYNPAATDNGGAADANITYTLSGTHAALFNIVAATGVVTLKASADFETKPSYDINVVATDAAGNASTQAVTVTVNDVDDTAPVFPDGATKTVTIDENAATSTEVYNPAATDNGGAADANITYTLSGADAALFNIVAATGVVTLKASADFETKPSYDINVIATDAAGNAAAQAVTVTVNDVLDTINGNVSLGPVIAGHDLTVTAYDASNTAIGTATVNPDGSFTITLDKALDANAVVTLKVKDADNTKTDYIDEATGVAKDLDSELSAVIVIQAGATSITVSVTPLTDIAAKILGATPTEAEVTQANKAVAALFGVEGDVTTATVETVIEDKNADGTGEIIKGNTYGQALAIISQVEADGQAGATTGAVTQTIADAIKGGSIVDADVKASLKAAQDNADDKYTDITPNANFTSPTIEIIPANANASSAEALGASLVQVTAEAGTKVTITFANADGIKVEKTITSATGTSADNVPALTASELSTLGDGEITLSAISSAADGSSPSAAGTNSFTLDTVAPTVSTTTLSVAENTADNTVVGTLAANEAGTWSASLTGADAGLFTLAADGQLTLNAAQDFEGSKQAFDLNATFTDTAGNETTQAITVNLSDVNEAPIVQTAISDATAVKDQAYNLDITGNFSDLDAGDSLTYSLSNNPSWMSIDAATGVISGTPTADAIAVDVMVTATDVGGLTVTDTFALTVVSAPVVKSIAASAAAVKAGDSVVFTITMSEAVTIDTSNGTPTVTLDVGGTDLVLSYASVSGDVLTFTAATIVADSDDSSVTVKAIDLNGATVIGDTTSQGWVTATVGQAVSNFVVDTTAPSALTLALADDTGSSNSDGITSHNVITVSGLEEGATWQYFIIGESSTWVDGVGNSFTLGATGLYQEDAIQVQQIDKAGNVSAVTKNSAITIDTAAPSFSSATTATAATGADVSAIVYDAQASNNASGSADDGVTYSISGTNADLFEFKDAAAAAAGQLTYKTAQTTEADHTVIITATDLAGNTTSHTVDISLKDFSTSVDWTGATSDNYINANEKSAATLSGTITGGGASVSVEKIDIVSGNTTVTIVKANITFDSISKAWSLNDTAKAQVAGLADGSYTANVTIKDGGNADVVSSSKAVTIDSVASLSAVALVGEADKTAAEAVDSAGILTLTAESSSDVKVVFTGAGGGTVTKTLTGTGSAQTITLDTGDLSTLGEGAVTVATTVTDAAGNTATSATGNFTLDTVDPSLSAVALVGDGNKTATEATAGGGVLTLTAESGSAVEVIFTGANNATVTKAISSASGSAQVVTLTSGDLSTLGEGAVTVVTTVADAAGNTVSSAEGGFTLDTVDPVLSDVALVDSDANKTATEATAISGILTFTAETGSAVEVVFTNGSKTVTKTINSATGAPQTVALANDDLTTLGDGAITVKTTATDAAGNTTESTAGGFTLDTTNPTATIVNNGIIAPNADLVLTFAEAVELGAGNITITNTTDSTSVEIAVTQGMISSDGKTITINPATDLVVGKAYSVTVAAGAFKDIAGNDSVAISNGWDITPASLSTTVDLGGTEVDASNGINAAELANTTISGQITSATGTGSNYAVTSIKFINIADSTTTHTVTTNIVVDTVNGSWSLAEGASWNAAVTTNPGEWRIEVEISATVNGSSVTGSGDHTATLYDFTPPTEPTISPVTIGASGNVPASAPATETVTAYLSKDTGTITAASLAAEVAANTPTATSVVVGANASANLLAKGLVSGDYKVYFVDAVGNVSAPSSNTITIDADAPTFTVPVSEARVNHDGTVTVNANEVGVAYLAKDGEITGTVTAAALEALVSGNTANKITVSANTNADLAATDLDEGSYKVYLVDAYGNVSAASTNTITVDTTAPSNLSITIKTGEDAYLNSTETSINLEVSATGMVIGDKIQLKNGSDNLGNEVEVTSSNLANGKVTITVAKTSLGADGEKPITAVVTDVAGNSAVSTAITLTVDTAVPTIGAVSLSWGTSLNATEDDADGTVTVATTGVEDGETVSLVINSQTYTGTVSSDSTTITVAVADLQMLTSGSTQNYTIDVSDTAGNPATQTTGSFTVDTVIPTLNSIVLTDTNLGVAESTTVTFTFSEALTADVTSTTLSADDAVIASVDSFRWTRAGTSGGDYATSYIVKSDAIDNTWFVGQVTDTNARLLMITLTDKADGSDGLSLSPQVTFLKSDGVDHATRLSALTTTSAGGLTTAGWSTDDQFSYAGINIGNFSLDDITAGSGTVTNLELTSDAKVYTATFTPGANLNDASNVITVGTNWADAAGNAATASQTSNNYEVNTVAPLITDISSSTSNGSFKVGETIALSVTVDSNMNSGSTIVVTLETGSTDRTATLTRDATNAKLYTGTYTVQAGDTSADLSVNSIVAGLTAPTDGAGNALITTLPANKNLNDNKALVIDGIAPTPETSNAWTVNAYPTGQTGFKQGDDIEVTLDLNEALTFGTTTGSKVVIAGNDFTLDTSKSNAAEGKLVFTYTVQANDNIIAADFDIDTAAAITLADITDVVGNIPDLTGITSAVELDKVVDTTAPTPETSNAWAINAPPAGQAGFKQGDAIEVTLDLNEALTFGTTTNSKVVIAGKDFTLDTSKSVEADGTLVFTYTVQANDNIIAADFDIDTAAAITLADITDVVGNIPDLTGITSAVELGNDLGVEGSFTLDSGEGVSVADGLYTHTGTSYGGIYSSGSIVGDGYAIMRIAYKTTASKAFVFGLSANNDGTHRSTVDYSIHLDATNVNKIQQNGIDETLIGQAGTLYSYSVGDYLKVERVGTEINYYFITEAQHTAGEIGTLLYTNTNVTTDPLHIDTAAWGQVQFNNVQLFNAEIKVDTSAPGVSTITDRSKSQLDSVTLTSDEAGFAYLVRDNLGASAVDSTAELEALVALGLATKVELTAAVSSDLRATGMPAGSYNIIVADTVGNLTTVSNGTSASVITVSATDNTAPTVLSTVITATDNADNVKTTTLVAGDKIIVTVTMSEATIVNVTGGTPDYIISVGVATRLAVYDSGSGTNSLTFIYMIQPGDSDSSGGITAGATDLSLKGGTLKDSAGNDAVLATPAVAANTNAVVVDTKQPTVVNIVDVARSTAETIAVISDEAGVAYLVLATLDADDVDSVAKLEALVSSTGGVTATKIALTANTAAELTTAAMPVGDYNIIVADAVGHLTTVTDGTDASVITVHAAPILTGDAPTTEDTNLFSSMTNLSISDDDGYNGLSVNFSVTNPAEATFSVDASDAKISVVDNEVFYDADGTGSDAAVAVGTIAKTTAATFNEAGNNVSISGNTITNTGAGNNWDNSGALSVEGFAADGLVSAQSVTSSGRHVAFGLSLAGNTTNSFTGMGYSIFFNTNGTVRAYVGGSGVDGINGTASIAYDSNDLFSIERIGTTINYLKNGEVFATSAEADATKGQALHLDTSFYTAGAALTNLLIKGSDRDTGNLEITFNADAEQVSVEAITQAVRYQGNAQTVVLSVTDSHGAQNATNLSVTTSDSLAPVATMETASALETALISVQSSETGTAYLVKDGEAVSTVSDLETAAGSASGAKVAITTADTATDLDTAGLVAGAYKLYTVDATGNISAASTGEITMVTTLTGTAGADTLIGGTSDDTITGGAGDDTLTGGTGDDTLTGGTGDDTLTGGTGSDIFDYNAIADANDTITDFTIGSGGDKLDLSDLLAYTNSDDLADFLTVTDNGNGNTVTIAIDANGDGGGTDITLTLTGIGTGALDLPDFETDNLVVL